MYIEVLFNTVLVISALIIIYNRDERPIYLSQGLIHSGYLFLIVPIIFCFILGNLLVNTIIITLITLKLKNKFVTKNLDFRKYEHIRSLVQNVIIIWPILVLISLVSKTIFFEFSEQDIVKDLRRLNNFSGLLSVFIMIVIIAPITEEILFRGLIYRVFKGILGPLFAAFLSSMLFAFVHLNLLSFPYLFIFGIILCIFYEKENTIIIPILIHSIFNGIMFTLILVT